MKEIKSEHTQIILDKLLEAVNAPKDFDFSQKNWYWEYQWSKEQEEDFVKWLAEFLRDKKYVILKTYRGQDASIYQARKLVVNYGWKLKLVDK